MIYKNQTVTTSDGQTIVFDHYCRGKRQLVVLAHGFYILNQHRVAKQAGVRFQLYRHLKTIDFRKPV